MIVDYEVTMPDLLAFNMYHARHSPALQRQLFISRVFLSVLTAVMAFIVTYSLPRGNEPLAIQDYILPLLPGAFIYWIYPLLTLSSFRKNIEKMMREGQNKGMLGTQRLELTPDALICTSDSGTETRRWSAVERVVQTEAHAYIYVSAVTAHIVPARAFDEQISFDAFVQVAQDYQQAQRSAPAPVV